MPPQGFRSAADLAPLVDAALRAQPIIDMHTHCYPPSFGHSADGTGRGLLLWGIDELVTYHYLVAEVFRVVPAAKLPYERFWAMDKSAQADHIWQNLFVDHTPMSEACRGVLTTLTRLGLDPNEKTLTPYRKWFAAQDADAYVDRVIQLANVERITMTNEVFSEPERRIWLERPEAARDPRFAAVLRIDLLLRNWPAAAERLSAWGYAVAADGGTTRAALLGSSGTREATRSDALLGGGGAPSAVRVPNERSLAEAARFLRDWIDRMGAVYVAMSLPPEFRYPDPGNPAGDAFIQRALMPVLEERDLPWALMIGCRQRVNPALGDAGDMVGVADVQSVVNLCRDFSRNRFLVTMLSRENQHELCVAARKFGNLLPFGCWWFLNNPSLIEEITRQRLELLGTSFVPQHSDARVLDQLVYKWDHSRTLIAGALAEKYALLEASGYRVEEAHVRSDARRLLRDNFLTFAGGAAAGR